MHRWTVGILATWALLAAATRATAQTQPRVSGSESSRGAGPTCVVAGIASDCAGSIAPGALPHGPGLVIAGPLPGPGPVPRPVLGATMGGSSGGRAGTDTDVQRSTRDGSAVAR
jgi:hypothetical protein